MTRLYSALVAVILAAMATAASAHALDPGFLDLRALGNDRWRVSWAVPQSGGQPLAMTAVLPDACDPARPPTLRPDGAAFRATWIADCPGGLEGGTIRIEGLEALSTDVLVRYEFEADESENRRLTPSTPFFVIPVPQGAVGVVSTYGALGVHHILTGYDHLLFVFGLILLVRGIRKLVGAITAFTVAHSLTLAAASLGWMIAPAPPVEAVVALSIMVLSVELVRRPESPVGLSESHPWLVSLFFGLLHGLGFARALQDIGLPKGDIPLALLSFNLGVEVGQLLFVGVVFLCATFLARLYPRVIGSIIDIGGRGRGIIAYGMGSLAASWLIARLAAF